MHYNPDLYVMHGVPSGRVAIFCPVCFRKTNIHASEREARMAWKRGEILKREDYDDGED
jgi:hypothetical protein